MGRLFASKLLTKYCQAFGFPPDLRSRAQKILNWSIHFQHNPSNASDRAEFIHDLFVDLLGYKSPFADNTEWELEFEPEVGLGFFGTNLEDIGMEAKIVWQDWDSSLCLNLKQLKLKEETDSEKWIIVLSDRSISLYSALQPDLLACERFEFEQLANLEQLKAFYFLFGRRTLLRGSIKSRSVSRLEQILVESVELELENCQEFYSQYQKIRLQLVKDFRYRLQPTESNWQELAIAQAQKLLNRILLITFAESCQLLPAGMLRQAYEFQNPYRSQAAWENYRAIFGWLREGNADLQPPILAFKLDLFDFDPLLDQSLFVGEELCRQIKELTKFNLAIDFSDRAIAEILNEIVKDLKPLRQEQLPKEKRKRFKLIAKNQSDRYQLQTELQTKLAQIKQSEESLATSSLEYWNQYQIRLSQLKIINRKCQNGIAIADAFNLLLIEYQTIDQAIADLSNKQNIESTTQPKSNDLIAQISAQLYACDQDCEAIEVTKLHFYLRVISLCHVAFRSNFQVQLANAGDCFKDFFSQSNNSLYFEI